VQKRDKNKRAFERRMEGEKGYLSLLKDILEKGHYRETRNGPTFSLFGKHLEFDLRENRFPLLTTKKMFVRGIFEELAFFMEGQTDASLLSNKGVNIWKDNTSREFLDSVGLQHFEEGDMGPMYFFQIYHFNAPYFGCKSNYDGMGMNQFDEVLHLLKTDRFSRRILMTTFNPLQAKEGVLYPCHGITIQFAVENDNELCCHMYQRSADCFLGLPFNIASYSLLLRRMCVLASTEKFQFVAGKLCISLGDCHIYESHVEAVREQLSREPFPFPQLVFKDNEWTYSSLEIVNYQCHPAIKSKMVA
jgi:thymidylate synthase